MSLCPPGTALTSGVCPPLPLQLSMELKGDGLYVSRGLSFRCAGHGRTPQRCDSIWLLACVLKHLQQAACLAHFPALAFNTLLLPPPRPPCREAEFSELECRLSPAQVTAYDAAAQLWQDLRNALVLAVAGGWGALRELGSCVGG